MNKIYKWNKGTEIEGDLSNALFLYDYIVINTIYVII